MAPERAARGRPSMCGASQPCRLCRLSNARRATPSRVALASASGCIGRTIWLSLRNGRQQRREEAQGGVEQADAADEGRLEAGRSIMVGPVTAEQGKVVRPSQLIRSVRRTTRVVELGGG